MPDAIRPLIPLRQPLRADGRRRQDNACAGSRQRTCAKFPEHRKRVHQGLDFNHALEGDGHRMGAHAVACDAAGGVGGAEEAAFLIPMIFDGRPVGQLTDAEIRALVEQHMAERRHLEFKLTVDHHDDEDRLETLLDVGSLANGGGGYLFIGIRDDGNGRAQVFANPGDTARISRSIRDLCLEHIEPRIDGIELQERVVDGHSLVIIRVPVSARTPHMITFQEGTHFWSRYQDGKRAMTYAEIHAAFTEDLLNRRLSGIEQTLGNMSQAGASGERREELMRLIRAGDALARLSARTGNELSQVNADSFREMIGQRAAFYLSATPEVLDRHAVDVDRDDVRALFRQAPDSRLAGWIVTSRYADIERFAEGIRYRGHGLDVGALELLTNGHMTYACFLGETFYWKQSREEVARQPRLWPFAIIEYPLSFFKLFRAIGDIAGLQPPFHVRFEYHNIRGHILPPGAPTEFGFIWGHLAAPYPNQDLIIPATAGGQLQPQVITYTLVRDVYAAFGYGPEFIPFWDAARGSFQLPRG
jgi:schlafen family protein